MPDPVQKLYISQITLPDGNTYELKDLEARGLIEDLAAGSLAFVKVSSAADTPEGVTWDNQGTAVTGTLVASVTTKGKIYLVPQANGAGKDIFAEYVTITTGGSGTDLDPYTYAWEKLGDTEIDFSGLGALAYKNSATGSVSFTTADSAAFSNGSVSASATYTPAGTVSVTLAQTDTAATLTTGDYTPEGTVSVTLGQTATAATLTKGDYTPEGTVSTPTITVTPSTTSIAVKDQDGSVSAGTAASFTSGTFNGGSCTKAADTFVAPVLTTNVSGETLTINFSQGSFTEGALTYTAPTHGADTFVANTPTAVTLPTFTSETVVDGITSATSSQPTFTGTLADDIIVTGVSYDKASVTAASFTGTEAEDILVTGVNYDKATVSAQTFSGTEATISSTGTASGDVTLTKTEKTETVTVS